jgi:hypothetical protein
MENKLLKEELSKILIKNNIIGRYSVDPMHRGGAEGFLRGSGHSHLINSDNLLEDLSYYIINKVPSDLATRRGDSNEN